MTDILMQLKLERRWTLVFLVVALGAAGIVQGWVATQASPPIQAEVSIEGEA